jgi:hypothetical protein|tara:strand:- start:31 stop:327 length:297 start_codon:yes stop_codon:yes gene_type:complete
MSTLVHERDDARLETQAQKVWRFLSDGRVWTLGGLSSATGAPEASVSARIRDFRKKGHEIEVRFVRDGLHTYRYIEPAPTPAATMAEAERQGLTARLL